MSRLLNIREICRKYGLPEKSVRHKFNRNTPRVLPRPEIHRISGYMYADEKEFLAWVNSPPAQLGRPRVRPVVTEKRPRGRPRIRPTV